MRLRAEIVIDIDATDFAEAAAHQERVERVFSAVRASYDQAQLQFRQRRERARRAGAPRPGLVHYTGRMAEYQD